MAIMELRKKSQITIPKDIIEEMQLHEGDKLDISQKDGIIFIQPVCVYPKSYVNELEEIAKESNKLPKCSSDITETINISKHAVK